MLVSCCSSLADGGDSAERPPPFFFLQTVHVSHTPAAGLLQGSWKPVLLCDEACGGRSLVSSPGLTSGSSAAPLHWFHFGPMGVFLCLGTNKRLFSTSSFQETEGTW